MVAPGGLAADDALEKAHVGESERELAPAALGEHVQPRQHGHDEESKKQAGLPKAHPNLRDAR